MITGKQVDLHLERWHFAVHCLGKDIVLSSENSGLSTRLSCVPFFKNYLESWFWQYYYELAYLVIMRG